MLARLSIKDIPLNVSASLLDFMEKVMLPGYCIPDAYEEVHVLDRIEGYTLQLFAVVRCF